MDVAMKDGTIAPNDLLGKNQPIRVCQFCFKSGTNEKKTFIQATDTVRRFLVVNATPTPFHYAYLSQLRQKSEFFFLCTNCDAWTRRNRTLPNAKNDGKKTLLAVDKLILAIMLPGSYNPPELRMTTRLITEIRTNNGRNWLASICPPLVVKTLMDNDICMESRKLLKSINLSAWKSGRRQAILGNPVFAKNIRCATHYT
jgi:hypothetical protein